MKYKVDIHVTKTWTVEVEADSIDQAEKLAYNIELESEPKECFVETAATYFLNVLSDKEDWVAL